MKPNNAGKDLWLLYQSANQKLKGSVLTQGDDGMQAFSVLYKTQLQALSQHYYISWEGGREALRALGPNLSDKALAFDMRHFKTQNV